MEYENALIDFLVYSYFGIIPKSLYDESKYEKEYQDNYNGYCTKMVIIKAYSDATNEGAYNTLFKKEIPNIADLKKASEEAKKDSATHLLKELNNFKEIYNFDTWHNGLCEKIVEKYSDVKIDEQALFSYGNAQKWVNMTMKYLWLLGLLPNCIKEEDLHIPVDSYIIDALWEDTDIVLPLKRENIERSFQFSQPSDYVKPWSQWEYKEDYEPFRKKIQKPDLTLFWENREWIKMSVRRKHTKQIKKYTEFFKAGDDLKPV